MRPRFGALLGAFLIFSLSTTALPSLAWAQAVCGNGTLEEGEECDDGNTTPGDGCDAECRKVVQKHGIIDKISEFFKEGGPLMFLNLFVSVIVITLIADRVNGLVIRNKLDRKQFMEHILNFVSKGRIQEALKLCRAVPDSALARVVAAGLSRADKGAAVISAGIEAAILDVAPEVKKRVAVLWSLANIATLIGLIGTIGGLISAFTAVSGSGITPDQKNEILGKGIAEAMNNTAFGLSIAVTCMIAHVLLNGRAKGILEDIERFSVQLENALVFRELQSQAS